MPDCPDDMTNALSLSLALSRPLSPSFAVSLSIHPSLSTAIREKEQRHFSPDHKDARHGDLRVHRGGAAAARPLRPGSGQAAAQEGNGDKIGWLTVRVSVARETEKLHCYYMSIILEVLVRKSNLFHRGDLQEVFDPPHYELFTLRDKVSVVACRDVTND